MKVRPRTGGHSSPEEPGPDEDRANLESGSPEIAPGVTELDHTADVGIAVEADSPAELFQRAAAGTIALMWSGRPAISGALELRQVKARADGTDVLLVRWLAELLYLLEVDGFVYQSAAIESLNRRSLTATVTGGQAAEPPQMEIKGVTYHGLEAGRRDERWYAQLIFDV